MAHHSACGTTERRSCSLVSKMDGSSIYSPCCPRTAFRHGHSTNYNVLLCSLPGGIDALLTAIFKADVHATVSRGCKLHAWRLLNWDASFASCQTSRMFTIEATDHPDHHRALLDLRVEESSRVEPGDHNAVTNRGMKQRGYRKLKDKRYPSIDGVHHPGDGEALVIFFFATSLKNAVNGSAVLSVLKQLDMLRDDGDLDVAIVFVVPSVIFDRFPWQQVAPEPGVAERDTVDRIKGIGAATVAILARHDNINTVADLTRAVQEESSQIAPEHITCWDQTVRCWTTREQKEVNERYEPALKKILQYKCAIDEVAWYDEFLTLRATVFPRWLCDPSM